VVASQPWYDAFPGRVLVGALVGDAAACSRAGGFLGQFAEYALASAGGYDGRYTGASRSFDSPAEERLAEMLEEAGLWYSAQHGEGSYRLDFFVVSPLGKRYDIEVDGRQHWSAEHFARDEVRDAAVGRAGYRVVRIDSRWIFERPDAVRSLLSRLV